MPFEPLLLRPGVVTEISSLSNAGGWVDADKVRFRNGFPESIGGWQRDAGTTDSRLTPAVGSYWGVARALHVWTNLAGRVLLGIGTNLKYYIQDGAGGALKDVTPLRFTTDPGDAAFSATDGSAVLEVTHNGHGAAVGDFLEISGAASLGGNVTAGVLNTEHRVLSVVDVDTYTIELPVVANAGDVGNGGASSVVAYQLNIGADIFARLSGYGSGGYGGVNSGQPDTGWGESPTGGGVTRQLRLWSHSNFGQDLIINPRGRGLYYWRNNANPSLFDRAELLSDTASGFFQTDSACPVVANQVLVSDMSRFVLAFGVNDYGEVAQDPMLVRWSDAERFDIWWPAATNQAGSYRLSIGSQILAAAQTRQEVLVWTDAAVYSMQYVGGSAVWGTEPLATNVSLIAPKAVVTSGTKAFWMGAANFYSYNGQVEILPCAVWKRVFENINKEQSFQVFGGTNDAFNEIWWFYCSRDSTEVDRYVVYNHVENTWTLGTLARTAWVQSDLRTAPLAAGYNGLLLNHEVGSDNAEGDTLLPVHSYVVAADTPLGSGHKAMFVPRMLPDILFDGSSSTAPEVQVQVLAKDAPGATRAPQGQNSLDTISSAVDFSAAPVLPVQLHTPMVFPRVQGRLLAFRIDANSVGTKWRMGTPMVDMRPSARRGRYA